jgi:hypothetical protein
MRAMGHQQRSGGPPRRLTSISSWWPIVQAWLLALLALLSLPACAAPRMGPALSASPAAAGAHVAPAHVVTLHIEAPEETREASGTGAAPSSDRHDVSPPHGGRSPTFGGDSPPLVGGPGGASKQARASGLVAEFEASVHDAPTHAPEHANNLGGAGGSTTGRLPIQTPVSSLESHAQVTAGPDPDGADKELGETIATVVQVALTAGVGKGIQALTQRAVAPEAKVAADAAAKELASRGGGGGGGAAGGATKAAPTIAPTTPGSLPAAEEASVLRTLGHIDAGTTPTGPLARKWGTPFRNRAGDRPGASGPSPPYLEYRVAPPTGDERGGNATSRLEPPDR